MIFVLQNFSEKSKKSAKISEINSERGDGSEFLEKYVTGGLIIAVFVLILHFEKNTMR